MVRREELEAWLNEYLRVDEIRDFIPNGLQIEGSERIDRIVTAVSINLEVVEAAVREKASAIIVHHGLFWKNDEPTIKGYRKERFRLLMANDINLFSFHLPLDVHPEIGHNRLILQGLGAELPEEPEASAGIGLKGLFPQPLSFDELVHRVNRLLNTEARFFRHGKDLIGSLFVISGGGRNELDEVLTLGVDAFLTGDARESTAYIARETGLNYIFAGHYNTEKPGVIELGRRVEHQFDVQVRFVDVDNPL
jgi:dinuclear metal center YbgI/SA1388 family protein